MMRAVAAAALASLALGAAACGADTTASAGGGTRIVAGKSRFGTMLFNSRHQAMYAFGADGRRRSSCYGACAQAWPPVYTPTKPTAGSGVKVALLGTTRRKDGRLQVTYAGRPLYYYAHEGPGQVLCHDVNLNGGIWKVVAPDGRPRR